MTIANSIVLADNAYGTIASGLAVGDTALSFTTGHGARFPAVATGQVLYCVLINTTNVAEEIYITAHSSGADSATIVRGQGSTTALTWSSGDRIEARLSSSGLKRLQDEAFKKTTISTGDGGTTYTGTATNTFLGYVTGLVYALTAATTNNVVAPTINIDGIGVVTVKLDGGGALAIGSMPLNGLYAYDGTNFILLNPKPAAQPTRQTFTSGSGTYNTPVGCTRVSLRMVGGGAGGAGVANPNGSPGGNGGTTSFNSITVVGGTGGATNSSATYGAGGVGGTGGVGVASIRIPGSSGGQGNFGSSSTNVSGQGGSGGSSLLGLGAPSGALGAGGAGKGYGAGGGGAGEFNVTGTAGGGGGGGGEYAEIIITSPSATYSYAVGAAGAGGAGGSGGDVGGTGTAGVIIVDEYYN